MQKDLGDSVRQRHCHLFAWDPHDYCGLDTGGKGVGTVRPPANALQGLQYMRAMGSSADADAMT